ncbi:MAG TPA: PQQ-dependent sugar dehydrogenase [Solirubrobacterales bacterium]|jgi:glucose/arabinose dehydrogenase|nr:PQQ-dependent sugar dehydrogenase [Solirubrobacterales bacterium]
MVIRAAGKLALACALLLGLWTGSARALSLQQIGSFEAPIFVTSDPGNPDRLFVVERAGAVALVENGDIKPFADIHSLVSSEGEGGLLSIALSPDFDQSGRFFLDYTGKAEGEIHIAEMRASGAGAPISSLRNLLTIPHPGQSNHYGGQLQFGPEGNLFASTGDGGGGDDQLENAQNLERLLGKILRIDPDPSGVLPYSIPAGNPFVGKAGRDEIWAYGLRNPFRFSFDRGTGALTIGDVGQKLREEVDYAPAPGLGAGANYGWNCREGFLQGTVTPEGGCADATEFIEPIFDYPHQDPGDGSAHGCAIIGGYVARGPGLGDVFGRYVYGDLCIGQIRSFVPTLPLASGDRSEGVRVEGLNSFGEDSCGRLYAVSGEGPVYRLVGSDSAICPTATPPLGPSFIGIRAAKRRVPRNRRVLVSVWVNPCAGRVGDPVSLWRGRRLLGTRHLDRVCSARFRPRISRRSSFRATVKADARYNAAISRRLTIKPRRRHRHR